MVVALLAGSSAFGDVPAALSQIQNTDIGLTNVIDLFNGDQAASALQNLAVQNDQFTSNPHSTFASQALFGIFAQVGHASGNCSLVGVLQDLATTGMQAQMLDNGMGAKTQGQSLDLLATQGVLKAEGAGSGNALNQLQLAADQEGGNVAGNMSQSSAILGLQNADVTGAATATGQVQSTMSVSTVQSQATL